MNSISLADRIRGCLLGVAIGDALGAPFEHVAPGQNNQLLERIGGYIDDFYPHWTWPAGTWTDDTGMTLASCRAIIESARTRRPLEECFRRAFKRWANSAECRNAGQTVKYSANYAVPIANSWGSGALMRMAPVAIYAVVGRLPIEESALLAFEVANLTHGHPLAVFPAVEFVLAIMSILKGESFVPAGLADPGSLLPHIDLKDIGYEEYLEMRHKPLFQVPPSTGLWIWRQVMENCLCLSGGVPWTKVPGFQDGILKTVNESFDRDTAGAVSGAVLGAYWGESGIPERRRSKVRKSEEIIRLADEMLEVAESG